MHINAFIANKRSPIYMRIRRRMDPRLLDPAGFVSGSSINNGRGSRRAFFGSGNRISLKPGERATGPTVKEFSLIAHVRKRTTEVREHYYNFSDRVHALVKTIRGRKSLSSMQAAGLKAELNKLREEASQISGLTVELDGLGSKTEANWVRHKLLTDANTFRLIESELIPKRVTREKDALPV